MNKAKFNKLNIHEKVSYTNSEIETYGSAKKVCENIDVSSRAFSDNIRNIYTYIPVLKKYVLISELETGLELANKSELQVYAQEHAQSIPMIQVDNAQEKMLDILNNYDKIMSAIEVLNNTDAPRHAQGIPSDTNAFMDLNMPSSVNKKTTIRVNEDIWNDFIKCTETEFNHLDRPDLISVALRDFINKYSVLK